MKIVDEIVKTAEEKYGNARYEDVDVIVADAEEWKSIIAEKLETMNKLAMLIANRRMDTGAHGVPCPYCMQDYVAPMQAWAGEIIAMFAESKDSL